MKNCRAKKGVLTSIINACKEKHDIPNKIIINPECVCTRVKRGKLKGGISGNTSLMVEIELYIIELIDQLT
jgi:hypothetical protein